LVTKRPDWMYVPDKLLHRKGKKHRWRYVINRNEHLVHQNLYRIYHLVLRFNPWVEASAGGLNWTVKKNVNSMNSSQNEGLSPSCIALSFDGFGSICGVFRALLQFSHFFPTFQLFRSEHHWGDLVTWNAHLVHQYLYHISFTSIGWCYFYFKQGLNILVNMQLHIYFFSYKSKLQFLLLHVLEFERQLNLDA
jgi:hypothetical protein